MRYDLLIIGGGLAGSSLAINMARAGARVLILEREASFRDRVRGEGIFPWECVEAKALGTYGSGLSMALRDVRRLRDELLAEADWTNAADRYAVADDRDFAALKRITDWLTDVNFSAGAEADAMRARLWPLWAAEPSRVPDLHGAGPDAPTDEQARQRFYGLC